MNKICTSIEQSKKLIELGLDVETADMVYSTPMMTHYEECDEYFRELPNYKVIITRSNIIEDDKFDEPLPIHKDDIPAWSSTTLLGLMPNIINEPPCLTRHIGDTMWICCYQCIKSTKRYDDPIDAVFEMACWLLKNNRL